MKITYQKEILKDELYNVVFYDINYYESKGEEEFLLFLEALLSSDLPTVYCSFGRTDMFLMDEATEENKNQIFSEIKLNGNLELVYEKNSDVYAYCCCFKLEKEAAKVLILKMFKFFYICSFIFLDEEVNWNSYKKYSHLMFNEGDKKGIKGYRIFKYAYTLSKGLGPDNFYFNYSKGKLPINIEKLIPYKDFPSPPSTLWAKLLKFFG